MPVTEPWWVCSKCHKPIVKVGKKGFSLTVDEHRKTCDPIAGGYISQIPQNTKPKRRRVK